MCLGAEDSNPINLAIISFPHPYLNASQSIQSIASHRVPIFSNITVCVSGISSILRRTQINKVVIAHGGTYVAALERPVRITHLLCGDEETDAVQYVEKFNRTGEADPHIQVVWEEWLWDCVEFGGRWGEDRYHIKACCR
ncbi:BRCT domain-containing protein [Mycena rebaudengoi]|nr:BRCT domain-containing protein [Mycena rebaudengoi]